MAFTQVWEKDLPIENCLLKAISENDLERIKPHLELTELCLGDVLYLPDEKIEYVYFPQSIVASVVNTLENGSSIEVGIIGREGIVGAEVVLNDETARREVNIQLAGRGFKMKTEAFQAEFERCGQFRKQILFFVGSYLSQITQNSACFSFHAIEQRLCRWLLMFDDRAHTDELRLTQEFIALMLGVHRPSVSKNANKLQKKGFISYNRGKITILDRKGLEDCSCECYRSGR